MIFRRLRLLQHLDALRHFYFCYSGDILSMFMQSIFNDDVESTLKDNSLAFVNNQLEIAVKMSLPERSGGLSGNTNEIELQKVFGFTQYLAENFEF